MSSLPMVGRPALGPTGLGASAARVRRSGANGSFWPPRFTIPFPLRVDPEVERMRAHGLDWARSRDLVTTDAAAMRLDGARFDRLTAHAVTADSPPLLRAFAELHDRSADGMSPAARGRFAEDLAQYLFTNYIEAFHRVRGGPDDLDTVTHMRRYSIGVLPSLDFGEPALGFEVDAQLLGGDPLDRMRTITADVIACVNEAHSLGKDLAIGETTSAAVVRYLQMMRDWMVASLAWSEETPRYGDHIPPSWTSA